MSVASSVPRLAQPLFDRSGRWSWLKSATFVALFLPGLWIALSWQQGWLEPKPVLEAIHGSGQWAVRLLLVSLLVSPLRRIARWNRLILIRRMLGLSVLAYLLIHFALYVVDLRFDLARVASEIALRIYLTIGFVALVGFCALGATSTDAMIRRIGPERWNGLHRVVYGLTILGLLHFFMQSKLDVTQPTLVAGFFLLLMGQRLLTRLRVGDHWAALLALAPAAGVATALLEAAWYRFASGVPPLRVLEADLDFSDGLRPAWWVAIVGLGFVVLRVARPLWADRGRASRPQRRTA
ncbi:ferric reductase-like transmembrane domain-containing protein [Lichenihabitans sp. Uapishka_5]|uniref:sulfite oxidase heme-binding subunit YedZ n=1 Tax=Lichenihabitans sp. Uapishka_5 TaxID=3037302 RepID=UPI0029E80ABF|nr:ferric reductase-like transmembrane domain-containing protein [Lichenihabitans sp. Uapishka_5]MDX7949688.1 ferric reductase-like transmembrane domain-containing protein [Lichenihabitans sp. Uapishka_5]